MQQRISISGWLAAALLTSLTATAHGGGDWPQIRGPGRDGIADGGKLARVWVEGGPAVAWRRPIGDGFSGIAAVGGRLYTMAAEGESEDVLCLDAASGETLWQTNLGSRFENQFGDGPRATPTVGGDTVYAVSADLRLAALATADGTVRWRHDLKEAFAATQPRFGFSASPLVDGELLILDVGGSEGRGVVAFDKRTGETRWTALDGAGGHSSPIAAEIAGRRQYVFNRRSGPEMVAVSTGGEVLWRHPGALDAIVMPLFVAPDRIFVSSAAMGNGGELVRVARHDGALAAEEVWTSPRMRNHFNTSVTVGGHIYGFDNATFRCLDAATGDVAWSARGFGKGSLAVGGDLLYVLGDTGILALVAATPERYEELGRVQAMEGRAWTPPTLAGGRLYLRDHDEMVSFDVSGTAVHPPRSSQGDVAAVASATPGEPETAAEVVARYVAARGGLERWRGVHSLELAGTYAAFSERSPFTLERHRGKRQRGDRYRLEHMALGQGVVKARDDGGPWWVFPLLGAVEPVRVEAESYIALLNREAMFEPPLFGHDEKGIAVELAGLGEVDGRPTVDLKVTFPDESVETWKLDAATYLEVAVDTTVHDLSQGPTPMAQRTFFSDFREVDGLVLPHSVAVEFGARLEEMTIEKVVVDPEIAAERFRLPPLTPAPPPAVPGPGIRPPRVR